ncbi:hypothetical protein BY996DRAFT_6415233 [Phakopsora pachyrhizi]|nr:hypothetical protein BY996DRAFT_6415233 [Phakopsora pachyrhizi]
MQEPVGGIPRPTEYKFLVKKLFGLGKKDENDDELESGISEGQLRRETIEPILQIEEYDDDNDKERDNKNHNQESSRSEVVATLKVFNVQAGSTVHTRALNNSKRFQSLEAVDKDFTPTRKGSQLDKSASSNFQKKSKEDLHILSPIYDSSPALDKCISNKMNIGLTPQLLTEPFGAIHAIGE